MACSRSGQSRSPRPAPAPSITSAAGNQTPRPGTTPRPGGLPSTPVGEAIGRLKYVPGK